MIKYDCSVNKVIEKSGATSWIFHKKFKPPLILSKEKDFILTVNNALQAINLPLIDTAVPELEELTGLRFDRGRYLWKNYEKGQLTIQRSLCKDISGNYYDCIWKITLDSSKIK